jgi:foldase protein PrsA
MHHPGIIEADFLLHIILHINDYSIILVSGHLPSQEVRCFAFLILVVALSACNSSSSQTSLVSPTANIPVEQTTEPIPEIRLVQPTPTNNQEQETVSNRAFEGNQPLAARVNDQPIFLDTYEQQVAQLEQALKAQGTDTTSEQGQEALTQIKRQVLDSLIDQLIIEQQADKLGITVTEETLEAKTQESITQGPGQAQFEEWLAANNLTLETFKETLRSQLIANQMFEHITDDVLETAEQVQIRQILVADEATARTIIEQLKAGTDFALLAQEQSLDESSRANGGNIDWFPRGVGLVPPEIETIAFSLQSGEIHGPIKTPLGFYIIKLENRETERALTPDMHQALKQQTFVNWLTEQRSLTTIEKYIEL